MVTTVLWKQMLQKNPDKSSWHYQGGPSIFKSRFQEILGDFLLNFKGNLPNMTKTVLKFQDILREFWVNKTLRSTE